MAPKPRRLPAYGRELVEAQRRGLNVPWLLIALDWSLGRACPRVVVPSDAQIAEIDFGLVRGLGCMVVHRGESTRALDTAEAVLQAGATECPVFDQSLGRLALTTDEVRAARGIGDGA